MKRIGKKGTTIDMFFIFIALMFFGMIILMSLYLADSIFPELIGFFGESNEATTVIKTAKQGYAALDNIFLLLFFMLNMVPLVFAIFVRHHPIFLVINIFVLIAFMFVVPSLSNAMREFWMTPEFAQYAVGGGGSYTFNIMTRLFQYMPFISVGLSVLIMIAMFVKSPTEGVTM